MYFKFAWRYFKAKKSTHAINIIAWVTTGVIAFATCCQILVLSVFNGFEEMVKSLYSSFYSDVKIIPSKGKTFVLDQDKIAALKKYQGIQHLCFIVEEKALLKNGEFQSVVQLKGVDPNYASVSGVPSKIIAGKFTLGNVDQPKMIVGSGIQNAAGITLDEAMGPEQLTVILPKAHSLSSDPLELISESNITASGVFSIQQDFDNAYAITNIDFIKQQMGFEQNEFSSIELKVAPNANEAIVKKQLQNILGNNAIIQNRYQQNENLYNTMRMEKWAIYAILTLILIIAAFNMISALTMLVLEKQRDISILQSMGAGKNQILKIFISEGLLLGFIGTGIGILLASIICFCQLKFKVIKLQGGSFLLDYFPVKLIFQDYLLVGGTAILIVLIASWLPALKASNQPLRLK